MTMKTPCGGDCGPDSVAAILDSSRRALVVPFHYDLTPFTLTAGGRLAQNLVTFSDSYFVCKGLVAVAYASNAIVNKAFTTQIINGATGRVLMDNPIRASNLFGMIQPGNGNLTQNGINPFWRPNQLLDPIVLPPSSNLQFNLVDVTNSGDYTLNIAMIGYRHFDLANPPRIGKPGARLEWYQYSNAQALTANQGPTNGTIRIDADSDFLVRKIMAAADGIFQVQFADASSKDNWFKNPEASYLTTGNAMYPHILPKPLLVKRNSAITVQLTDLSADDNDIQIVLEGAKVYR